MWVKSFIIFQPNNLKYMKRIFLLMLCVTFFIPVFAQDEKSYDVVLKLSGEEHIGNVIEMDDTSIKFVHKGESLRYTFKKQMC